MAVFGEYARFYDLLYADKDYAAECRWLRKVFARYARGPVRTLLDLGCGTGGHAFLLADAGMEVTGVDRSASMLRQARAKAAGRGEGPRFLRGDIRSLRLSRKFDAAVAMFAVMGYQTEDGDFVRAARSAAFHLKRGGLFVFDIWFGPAVLHDPPRSRKKTVSAAGVTVSRRTDCRLDLGAQTVEVRFRTAARGKDAPRRVVEEVHRMRFFFPRELHLLLGRAGLKVAALAPFMALGREPGVRDWNVTVVARKAGRAGGPSGS